MTIPPPDGSRDRRIEDSTNLWVIHPAARVLLPLALRLGISANMVSFAGLGLGIAAAYAFAQWNDPRAVVAGLLLSVGWLIADGLDGMIARATKTASAFGRLLDGLCDHGVFALFYLTLAATVGTLEGWLLAIAAGLVHALQSNLFEGERTRFHRRLRGDSGSAPPPRTGSRLEKLYDDVSRSVDRLADPFDRALAASGDAQRFGRDYATRAAAPMKLMAFESANMRVAAIFLACLAGDPRLFWWFELVPLTLLLAGTLFWHRRVEAALVSPAGAAPVNT
ncbi:CDP-alcohol phosphatidyltransferase family protein [Sphingomonas sp. PB4P5]|uniref:CDP-alcohol phosphatidyltransferase family protein n=1 Tax=Parasphingomonas puruogangriensis TaxID=3096155 RepID=UPI002FC7E2BC